MSELFPDSLIQHIRPRNFLSFGPNFPGLELGPLNILIGPNGCGKSNLIEAIDFMRHSTGEFAELIRGGGGVREWIWKGHQNGYAGVSIAIKNISPEETKKDTKRLISHDVMFDEGPLGFSLFWEGVKQGMVGKDEDDADDYFAAFIDGEYYVWGADNEPEVINSEPQDRHRSVLANSKYSSAPTALILSYIYENIRIYRDWTFGRRSALRDAQKADLRNDILAEDFSNLGSILSRIKTQFPEAKREILGRLRDLYGGLDDFDVLIEPGTVQACLSEGNYSIPTSRLSDGTLRYLCLLTILCDPEPPHLICIEEPEVGLHPDILPGLADLMKEASKRTQLIITTHSDILVDAMTDMPEAIVVCEKVDGATTMKRLKAEDLTEWLEDYRLGQLWSKGHLGGVRW